MSGLNNRYIWKLGKQLDIELYEENEIIEDIKKAKKLFQDKRKTICLLSHKYYPEKGIVGHLERKSVRQKIKKLWEKTKYVEEVKCSKQTPKKIRTLEEIKERNRKRNKRTLERRKRKKKREKLLKEEGNLNEC